MRSTLGTAQTGSQDAKGDPRSVGVCAEAHLRLGSYEDRVLCMAVHSECPACSIECVELGAAVGLTSGSSECILGGTTSSC